jgi:hypothetical protein
MGLQHGELAADILQEGADFVDGNPLFYAMLSYARTEGLIDEAKNNAYEDVLEECQGMVEAVQKEGVKNWDMDKCITLAYGDAIVEYLRDVIGFGCTQFVATNDATLNNSFIHGRSLDWADIGYMIDHPTIIVRHPTGKIPYAIIGFPGCVAPYSGINKAGLAVASNENTAVDDVDHQGRSHTQMIGQILSNCNTLAEAEEFILAQDHLTAESLMISDAANRQAAVFEMTANHIGIRRLDSNGLVYMTNHFVHEEMADKHTPQGEESGTVSRYRRLEELLEPDGQDSLYGQIDVAAAISILRDRKNYYTGETHPPELFDVPTNQGGSIANNSNLHVMVFVPEERTLYLAVGEPPVPYQKFIGFHLDELFDTNPEAVPNPLEYE